MQWNGINAIKSLKRIGRGMIKKKPNEVHFMCNGFQTHNHVNVVEEFFQILKDTDEAYLPKKIGMGEPIKTPFSIAEAKKVWGNSLEKSGFNGIDLLNSKYWGSIDWKSDNSNVISLWIKTDLITAKNGTGKFIELAKKLFLWSNSVYGFACHTSKLGGLPGSGLNYRICLGDIRWMTLFGPPYVKMFGKDVIETAPCKVDEFAENYFMLLTSEEPTEITPELLEIQEKVKIHLGVDAFVRKEPRKGILTMEDLIAGEDTPSKEGYRSPNFSEYMTNLEKQNNEGLISKVNEDRTITTYNINPEK